MTSKRKEKARRTACVLISGDDGVTVACGVSISVNEAHDILIAQQTGRDMDEAVGSPEEDLGEDSGTEREGEELADADDDGAPDEEAEVLGEGEEDEAQDDVEAE